MSLTATPNSTTVSTPPTRLMGMAGTRNWKAKLSRVPATPTPNHTVSPITALRIRPLKKAG